MTNNNDKKSMHSTDKNTIEDKRTLIYGYTDEINTCIEPCTCCVDDER
jgi:hypothetical protein